VTGLRVISGDGNRGDGLDGQHARADPAGGPVAPGPVERGAFARSPPVLLPRPWPGRTGPCPAGTWRAVVSR